MYSCKTVHAVCRRPSAAAPVQRCRYGCIRASPFSCTRGWDQTRSLQPVTAVQCLHINCVPAITLSTGFWQCFFFFFFFLRGSPRYYIGANRTLPSTHAIGYVGKPVRVEARRALPQEDNAIPKRSASMKAYHRKATPSDGHVPSTRG